MSKPTPYRKPPNLDFRFKIQIFLRPKSWFCIRFLKAMSNKFMLFLSILVFLAMSIAWIKIAIWGHLQSHSFSNYANTESHLEEISRSWRKHFKLTNNIFGHATRCELSELVFKMQMPKLRQSSQNDVFSLKFCPKSTQKFCSQGLLLNMTPLDIGLGIGVGAASKMHSWQSLWRISCRINNIKIWK